MRVAILAGGLGTRLAEETDVRPKPMIEIGGRPILWHIMKLYAHHGFSEFHVALGFKGEVIKRYFLDYFPLDGSLTIDLGSGGVTSHEKERESWVVHLLDTGLATGTGGRVKRLEPLLRAEGTFMLTYGDGVSDVDLSALLRFHRAHGRIASLSAVRPPSRYGSLLFDGDRVAKFVEKPQVGEGWISGGFFVFEPQVFDYIEGDESSLESEALERLARDGQLMAYRHERFWQCMDTVRDKRYLEKLWSEGPAPWKVWR